MDRDNFNNLTDDCLVAIFKQLPLRERFLLEKTCRRWKDLMPYSDIQVISFSGFKWKDVCVSQFDYQEGNLRISQEILMIYWLKLALNSILVRCGSYVREINLHAQAYRIRLNGETIQLLAENAPFLSRLNLYNCILSEDCVPLLAAFSRLEYLNMAAVIFIDQTRSVVAEVEPIKLQLEALVQNHRSLEQLNLAGLKFSPQLRNSNLKKLHLQGLSLTNEDLELLIRTNPNIVSLGLNSCRRVTNFSHIGNGLPNIRKLWLNFTAVSDEQLAKICRGCSQLEQLRIDGCNNLTDFNPLRCLEHLSVLWVGPNPMFSNGNLARVARYGKLQNLVMSGCNVNDEGLRFLSGLCRGLIQISVAHTMVTDVGLICLLKKCTELEFLNAQYTSASDMMMDVVGSRAHNLETLYVQSCPQITEDGLRLVLRHRREFGSANYKPLTIMTGGDRGNPVSDQLMEEMKSVGVNLISRRPMLALPGAADQ